MKTVTITELKERIDQVLNEIHYKGTQYLLVKTGQPSILLSKVNENKIVAK